MRTDRVYRKALTYDAALAEVRANRGAQFDPRVADALIVVVEREAERDRSDRAALPYAA
jgi:HD-GYP domain-containing protein (c-di-GMP phosphodiesterase class II)